MHGGRILYNDMVRAASKIANQTQTLKSVEHLDPQLP